MHLLPMQELPYDPNQVTPGVIGFAATAIVAIAVMLLMWDFNRRVRRISDREEARERLQAEVEAAQQAGAGAPDAVEADGVQAATDAALAPGEAPSPDPGR